MNNNLTKELFAYFEQMIPHCYEYAEKNKAEGKGLVSIFCEYTPRELIMAADAVPVCVCAGTEETIPSAEEDLPSNLCPLIKSSYGYAKLKTNPFLEMADLVVGETTCDGKKKMYELLKKTKDVYVIELSQRSDSSDALNLWKAELVKFKQYLEKKFHTAVTDDKLRAAIKLMNRERYLRRKIAEYAQLHPPALTGAQVLTAKSSISCMPDDFKMYENIIAANIKAQPQYMRAPRILMTGVPMPYMAEKLLEIIEKSGGIVVAQESCTGLKPIYEDVIEDKDPITALAEKYFHLPCSVMTPNNERFRLLDMIIADYKPEAVVELIWRACHTYNIESILVQKHVEEKHNLPYLKLETDYSPSDSAQLKVRIQTLLEIVKSRRSR
ncbi:MAG: double-cubane-cluster-containing anaerobic reductase [bacterium]